MRYRRFDCYPGLANEVVLNVIWQDESKVYGMKDIRLAIKYHGYKKISEGVLCKLWDEDGTTPYGFYFIPETHPLFNSLIFTSDLASKRIEAALKKSIVKQLLNIIQQ